MQAEEAELVARLVRLLDLEELDRDLFRGPVTHEPWSRVFGGQVVGQALMAACRTVPPERPPHSLHAYFMRAGDATRPIIFKVFRDRDGGSFSTRRVVAEQNGVPIFNLAASFHRSEPGFTHQAKMPVVPPPEGLRDDLSYDEAFIAQFPEHRRPLMRLRRPLQFRATSGARRYLTQNEEPAQSYWFRVTAKLPEDRLLHRVVLAYATDFILLSTSTLPHPVVWNMDHIQEASLDHALWLHEDVQVDDWLLYTMDSPWAGGARGLNRGLIFTRAGKLVASVMQEGLIRPVA